MTQDLPGEGAVRSACLRTFARVRRLAITATGRIEVRQAGEAE